MTSPSQPTPELLALLATLDATVDTVESAVAFRLNTLVGSGPAPAALEVNIDCEAIDIGTGIAWNAIEVIIQQLCALIKSLTNQIAGLVGTSVAAILEFIREALSRLIVGVEDIVSRVTSALATAVFAIFDKVEAALDTILGAVSSVVNSLADTAWEVVTAIGNAVRATISAVGSAVGFIIDKVRDGFGALLDAASAVIASIKSTVGDIISAIVDTANRVFVDVSESLARLIDVVVGAAESGLGAVREVIENIPAALREIATDAASTLTDVVGAPLAGLGTLFVEQVEAFFASLIDDLDVAPDKIIRDFLLGLGLPADVVEKIAQTANTAMPRTPGFFVMALAFLVPILLMPVISTALGPMLEQMRQESNRVARPTLLSPADAIVARVFGEYTDAQYKSELLENGYTPERADLLLSGARRVLDVGELLRWWLRDIITEDQLDELIHFHRIADEDIERLKEAVFFVPPVQDLITMAVREVFSPEIRTTFRLDEDFPTDFEAFARKRGISTEWAQNYWAAHWVLPSLTQGFMMLHRRVVTADELNILMRAQDVMPFWREKLTEIAFSPLTRVDVRRMHGLGLIGEDDLIPRYMDLGFNESNADMMAKFTIAFNAPDAPEVLELEGLTRSVILGMFDDGVLTEREAKEIMMTGLGLSDNVAALFITHRKLVRERSDRGALITSIIDLAGGGIIQLPEAQDSLARAGLTAVEIAGAVKRILDRREKRDRLPTVAELAKMRDSEIIDVEVWHDAMAGHGYPDVWIDRLADLQSAGGDA